MAEEKNIDIFNPVHQHGGLVLQSRYEDIGLKISPLVRVYHTPDNKLVAFKDTVEKKIKAGEQGWDIGYYSSDRPLESMIQKKGEILVLACPNVDKIEVIDRAVKAGYELILCDKPWVIEPAKMSTLTEIVEENLEGGPILYDIMTEQYESGTIMQKLIMDNKDLFGVLEKGTEDKPAIKKHSIHILDKSHQGFTRPPKYFDTRWQGEGIVDVTTHLVYMANWLVRTDKPVYPRDVDLIKARCRRWTTTVPQADFENITQTQEKTPGDVYCNGAFGYRLDGVNIGLQVEWKLKGIDDEHYSKIEGSKVTIEVVKGPEDKHQQVYITPKIAKGDVEKALKQHVAKLNDMFDRKDIGYKWEENKNRFRVTLPGNMYTNHVQHFAEVTTQALKYLAGQDEFARKIENSRLLTKYYLTTTALAMARSNK